MKFRLTFFILLLPFLSNAQESEKWVESNYHHRLYISPDKDSIFVGPLEKVAKRVKERKIVFNKKLFRIVVDRKRKQLLWLQNSDTLASIVPLKGKEHLRFAFQDGSNFTIEKESLYVVEKIIRKSTWGKVAMVVKPVAPPQILCLR